MADFKRIKKCIKKKKIENKEVDYFALKSRKANIAQCELLTNKPFQNEKNVIEKYFCLCHYLEWFKIKMRIIFVRTVKNEHNF